MKIIGRNRCLFVLLTTLLLTQTQPGHAITKQENLQRFSANRIGIFVHYGPRTMFDEKFARTDFEKHRQFPAFNPEDFDASEWARTFKNAGARYVTVITKHMYGYNMFDNPYSEFKITNSRFGRDWLKELSTAVHDADMDLFLYYSTEGGRELPEDLAPANMDYETYRARSIEHLLTNYGEISGLWWDGGDAAGPRLMDVIQKLAPHAIMNGRIRFHDVPFEKDWMTPEQVLGQFEMQQRWESCIPLEGHKWFYYNRNGGKDVKGVNTAIKMIANAAGNDGNVLFNVSPMPNGKLDPEQVATLDGMGQWLRRYGDGIYGTRGGPYKNAAWGQATRKGNKVYLFISQINKTGRLDLPPLPARILKTRMLSEGRIELKQESTGLRLELDRQAAHPDPVTVLELTLDSNALALPEIDASVDNLATDKDVASSSQLDVITGPEAAIPHSDLQAALATYGNRGVESAAHGLSHDFRLRERGYRFRYWAPAEGDRQPFIEIRFGKTTTFNSIKLQERHGRIRRFELQFFDGEKWQAIYQGDKVGIFSLRHPTVSATAIRLQIIETEAHSTPEIHEIDVFYEPDRT